MELNNRSYCGLVFLLLVGLFICSSASTSIFISGTTVLSYVNMVCGSLRNSIPKSIVYCQVREAKRSLLDHFFAELGKKEARQLGSLLDEDPAIMQRRVNLGKRLELYRAAQLEIDAVAWAK